MASEGADILEAEQRDRRNFRAEQKSSERLVANNGGIGPFVWKNDRKEILAWLLW